MFWRRIISALMLGVGVALVLRNLMNLVSQIREKKRKEDEDAGSK
ncbi:MULTISPECIES: hypothetical protein [unclassified Oceanispirochaeta]|nr:MULTISPECIES: hypothetical protein [unclassified Oceanispirochaeta]